MRKFYRDSWGLGYGQENGNYCFGFRVQGLGINFRNDGDSIGNKVTWKLQFRVQCKGSKTYVSSIIQLSVTGGNMSFNSRFNRNFMGCADAYRQEGKYSKHPSGML